MITEQIASAAVVDESQQIRAFAESVSGMSVLDDSIRRITVKAYSNIVKRFILADISVGGKLDLSLSNGMHVKVLGIFQANQIMVVTPNRDKTLGTVYFFDQESVLEIART